MVKPVYLLKENFKNMLFGFSILFPFIILSSIGYEGGQNSIYGLHEDTAVGESEWFQDVEVQLEAFKQTKIKFEIF